MERLQKVMAHAGVASRRRSEEYILAGRVKVNGEIVKELGVKVTPNDLIEVDDVPIYKEEPKYILLYKPKNTISAVTDDLNRTTVVDLITNVTERIYPIGRLDWDTTGLILLTNDGEFANLLMHPRYQVPKVYIATVMNIPTEDDLNKLRKGLSLDGKRTSPARARIIRKNINKNTAIVELTIYEGWNHQVKRMFDAIGAPVSRLKREKLGFLDLGHLNPGEYRELNTYEVDRLRKTAESKRKSK